MEKNESYTQNNYVYLADNSGGKTIPLNLWEKKNRILRLEGIVNHDMASCFAQDVAYLNSVSEEGITVIVSSNGGSVEAGLHIINIIENTKAPITTVCFCEAYSMAALIFAAGSHRIITPFSRVMIHSPATYMDGGNVDQMVDIAKHLKDCEKECAKTLARFTHRDEKELIKAMKKETFFNPEEAVAYGLADEVLPLTEILYKKRRANYE